MQDFSKKKQLAREWFTSLRDKICDEFVKIEGEFVEKIENISQIDSKKSTFDRKMWQRETSDNSDGGGGEMSVMKGHVFEKVGVNISTVFGQFDEKFRSQIPGTEESGEFFATGISLVAHMKSPLVPAIHMNTRYIVTSKDWFGGGSDLNPIFEDKSGES